jgi:V/A-type H+-transporting ATPase subunit C
MSDDFAYINARVRAMRSRLIPVESLEALEDQEGLESVIDFLNSTESYSDFMAEAQSRYSGVRAVEAALGSELEYTYQKVLSLTEGRPRDLLLAFMRSWDIRNLKAIVRGIARNADIAEIRSALLPAGELDRFALESLARERRLEDVIDVIVSWGEELAEAISEAFEDYRHDHDLACLELRMDRHYYESSLSVAEGRGYSSSSVADLLRLQIDLVNIVSTLKRLEAGDSNGAGGTLVSGGHLPEKFFGKLKEAQSTDYALQLLESTPYRSVVEKASFAFSQSPNLSALEGQFDRLLFARGIQMFRDDPLSISVSLGYLWMKMAETVNLRTIARGKAFGMPWESIRERMLLV